MTKSPTFRKWCIAWGLSLACLPISTIAQTPSTAPATPAVTASDDELLGVIGYLVAERARMNIGYTDEELDAIVAGLRRCAKGEGRPENFEALLPQAQAFYFQRVNQYNQERAQANRVASEAYLQELAAQEDIEQTESGLRYQILEAGADPKPTMGQTVIINYRGSRIDGTEFDAQQNARFPLQSRGGAIEGFKEGLQLIGKGGAIKLIIPPELAYGDTAPPGSKIQPGDVLIFDVELLDIIDTPAPPTMPRMPANLRPPGPPPSTPDRKSVV